MIFLVINVLVTSDPIVPKGPTDVTIQYRFHGIYLFNIFLFLFYYQPFFVMKKESFITCDDYIMHTVHKIGIKYSLCFFLPFVIIRLIIFTSLLADSFAWG